MNINLVTLEGCSRCERLNTLFLNAGIKFHSSTCEEDPQNCDNLEALVESAMYPMVLITNSKNEIFEVLFLASSYEKLNEGIKNKGDISCIPQYSIDNMLLHVKKKLNLNK